MIAAVLNKMLIFWLVVGTAVLSAPGCSNSNAESMHHNVAPQPIGSHECEACGMLVRDQTSPRAQLVHKDGTRHFFCSVSDMLTYSQAPSPHGPVVASFVESLDAASEPLAFSTEEQPWSAVSEVTFVIGVDKPKVMGTPVLVYTSPAAAQAVANKHSGRVLKWNELQKSIGLRKE